MTSDTPTAESQALHDRVLRAALEVIRTDGLAALTIAELTARSGVSNGSLYHHFGSRGGIVRALYADVFAGGIDAITDELDERPAAVAVPAAASAYVRWCCADRARATLLYEGITQVDDRAGLAAAKDQVFAPVVAWFTAQADAGEVRPIADWQLDPIMMAPAHECIRRDLLSGGAWSAGDVADEIGQAVWALARPTADG